MTMPIAHAFMKPSAARETAIQPDDQGQAPIEPLAASSRADVRYVLLMSGLCGLYLGMAGGWQVAIESAQALAGVVSYPADNPFYMYHVKTWTLLHQGPALLLWCGLSERTMAVGLAGLIGMISFAALAMTAFALSNRRLMSLAVPLVALAANACKDSGGIYPIRLLSDRPWVTYGAAGTSLALLAWALPAVGFYRLGGFLMGLAPAVHPTLGGWCLATGVLSLLWQRRDGGGIPASFVRYLLLGCLVSAASLAVHLVMSRGLPDIDSAEKDRYIAAFAARWDSHRKIFPLESPVVLLGCTAVVTAAAAARTLAGQLTPGAMMMLRAIMLSSFLSLILCLATQWQTWLPRGVVMAMPGRFINITGLAAPALLLGLLARSRGKLFMAALLSGLLLFFLLRMLTLEEGRFYVPPASKVLVCASLMFLILFEGPLGGSTGAASPLEGDGLFRLVRPWALLSLALYSIPWKGTDPALSVLIGIAVMVLLLVGPSGASVQSKQLAVPLAATGCSSIALMALALLGGWLATLLAAWTVLPWLAGWARPADGLSSGQRRLRRRLEVGAGLVCSGLALVLLTGQARSSWSALVDWRNDPVFARAARGDGLLLTASRVRAVQLRTRRPVLLEGAALNQLPYVPSSGPAMNRILNEVYGEDLFYPRFRYRKDGGLAKLTGKDIWETRESLEWARLAGKFGFRDVLTYADWELQLPVVARNKDLVLYHVPMGRVADGGWRVEGGGKGGRQNEGRRQNRNTRRAALCSLTPDWAESLPLAEPLTSDP